MTHTNTEQEHAEFEERFKHLDLTQEPDAWGVPRYKHAAISLAWEAWQAALSAQVVAKEQQAEWQPIETAPKDSSYVLLAGKYRNDAAVRELIDRLQDAQQDINLAANTHMSQQLASAAALLDEVESTLLALSAAPGPSDGESNG